MNCHGDNKDKQTTHKHNSLKHMLHMLICCGLPIIIIGFLPIISRVSPSAGSFLAKLTPFLCPIMMIAMIPMMIGNSKKSGCCENKSSNHDEKMVELDKHTELDKTLEK